MPEYISREAVLAQETVMHDEDGFDCFCVMSADIRRVPAADVVEVSTVKAWLYAIAMNNVGVKVDDAASVCEDIAERMDGLRAFARERRGEDAQK